jgi:hypothetical protein
MRFYFKGFTSLVLAVAFVGLASSGVLLYFAPRGRVANWTGWTWLGLTKNDWTSLHTNLAILVIIAAIVHLISNWSVFWGYIKKKAGLGLNLKWEMVATAMLFGIVVAGAIRGWPPFSTVMAWNQRIKDTWEPGASDAPAPHAEEFTLERLAASMNLPAEEVAKAIEEEGFAVASTRFPIGQIAEANQVTPQAIHAAIRKRFPQANHAAPGQGMGRGQDTQDRQPGKGWGKGQGLGKGAGMGKGMGKRMGMGMGGGQGAETPNQPAQTDE